MSGVPLTGAATFRLGRLLSKGPIPRPLRLPFTKVEGAGAPAELNETPKSSHRALGALLDARSAWVCGWPPLSPVRRRSGGVKSRPSSAPLPRWAPPTPCTCCTPALVRAAEGQQEWDEAVHLRRSGQAAALYDPRRSQPSVPFTKS
ncbi:DUF1360 domain-containing protein [Streptomyces sp. NPDC054854]